MSKCDVNMFVKVRQRFDSAGSSLRNAAVFTLASDCWEGCNLISPRAYLSNSSHVLLIQIKKSVSEF